MSSAILRHQYRPRTGTLSLWFAPDWRRYDYFDVPRPVYEALLKAPSMGRYFNRFIRNRYDYRPVGPSGRARSAS